MTSPPAEAPSRPPVRRQGFDLAALARRSPVSLGLIAVNLGVFSLQLLLTNWLGVDLVISAGAKENSAIAAGQYWRLLTPVFIHAGLPHLLVNMYSLYIIGPATERMFGHRRFLAFFLLSGLTGTLFSLVFNPYPSVGASGAIFGLLGMLGAFWYIHRTTFGPAGTVQLRQIIMVAVLNLLIGLSPGIDFWAHLGGFLAGIVLALTLGPRYQVRGDEAGAMILADLRPWRKVRTGVLAATAILLVLIAVAVLSLG